jgi:hypothetical protein
MSENVEYIVPHPRYGDKPRASECPEAVAAAREKWGSRYFRECVFPESAIMADTSKQNYSTLPQPYYVDVKKTCRDCGRYFIFFAEEQRYWYEDLGFYIWADCVRCPECRKDNRTLRHRFDRYSLNIKSKKDDLDDDSLAILVDDSIFLWEYGLLKKEEILYHLRKIACARIPDHPTTKRVNAIIDSLRSIDSA